MPFSEVLNMAFQNIRSNLLRAVLTLLIIAFGIMALVGILTAIDAIAYSLNSNFSGLGANSFRIERKWEEVKSRQRGKVQKRGEVIRYDQAMEFKERFSMPAVVAIGFRGSNILTVKAGEKKTNPNIGLIGADENYFAVKGIEIEFGRNFSIGEVQDGQAKVIVGRELVKLLFDDRPEKALDQMVMVGDDRYRIIGILKSKGASMGTNTDRTVFTPIVNAKMRYGTENTSYNLLVAVNNATDMELVQSEAIGLFRQIRSLRPGDDDDFGIFASDSLIGILKDNTRYLRWAAMAIGAITLFAAAIGLMNIMLVSVTERTREIGIYKSLGATRRNILLQFLTEAVTICQIGGVVGVLLGILIGNVVTFLLGGSFLIPWLWIILGLVLCMIVGVVSGFYPAMKAAQLDPIEALRYE